MNWYYPVFQQTKYIWVYVYMYIYVYVCICIQNHSSTRLVGYQRKEATTHCSSSRLIGHHSQTLHHTSSQHWCTCHCCTWTQRICRAGEKLCTQINVRNTSQQAKTLPLFKLDSGFSLLLSLPFFCGEAFYLKLRYRSAQVDRDQCFNVGPEYNYSIQQTCSAAQIWSSTDVLLEKGL